MNTVTENVLKDDNLDGGGNPILIGGEKMDNEYAQMVQDLLEMRG